MEKKTYPWQEKKRQGDLFERFIVRDIRRKKYSNAIIDNPNKKFEYWDIYVNDDITIECKHDVYSSKTGNICIEFAQDDVDRKRKDSGINLTKAKYYIICDGVYDGKTVYLISVDKIKELIAVEYEDKIQKLINGDDSAEVTNLKGIRKQELYPLPQGGGYVKYMSWYLIPKELFKEYCLEVNSIFEMTYNELK